MYTYITIFEWFSGSADQHDQKCIFRNGQHSPCPGFHYPTNSLRYNAWKSRSGRRVVSRASGDVHAACNSGPKREGALVIVHRAARTAARQRAPARVGDQLNHRNLIRLFLSVGHQVSRHPRASSRSGLDEAGVEGRAPGVTEPRSKRAEGRRRRHRIICREVMKGSAFDATHPAARHSVRRPARADADNRRCRTICGTGGGMGRLRTSNLKVLGGKGGGRIRSDRGTHLLFFSPATGRGFTRLAHLARKSQKLC